MSMTSNTLLDNFADLVPSDDWELNVLLLDIAKALSHEEFERLKFLCTGSKGVPKRVLSHLTTAELFFTYLRERMMISRDNLLLLQAFLWHLDRKDLHALASNYAKRIGNALYFFAPKEEPDEGFQHVQFHVDGNLDRFQRPELEALRATVARLLFVPQEFIFLSGVEPNNSLTLTFLINEQCATELKQVYIENRDSFDHLGVDGISMRGSEHIAPAISTRRRASAPAGEVTHKELRALYERTRRLETQVEESEIRSLESQADATIARKQATEWRHKENYFRSLLARVVEREPSEELVIDEGGRILI